MYHLVWLALLEIIEKMIIEYDMILDQELNWYVYTKVWVECLCKYYNQ